MKKALISGCSTEHPLSRFITILLLLLSMVIITQKAHSAQVVLTWTKITDATGYKIHIGPSSGNYTQSIDVDNVTTYTIDNLASGSTNYIASTAHNASGVESGFSNEVIARIPAVYSITTTSDINGAIIPSGNPPVSQASNGSYVIKIVTVGKGANQSFTITPNAGYRLADLKADGTSLGAAWTYTFSNVTTDHTLNATFTINNYSITATAGTGGSISPAGATAVNSGANKTYTITPATGYQIAGVKVDGVSVGAVSTYTFSKVTASHTIQASFSLKAVSTNIAPLASVTASSQDTSTMQFAKNAVDGVINGYPGDYTKEWSTVGQLAGAWINLKWTRSYVVDKIVLFDRPNLTDNILSGTLTFSDGSSITVGQLANNGTGKTVSFPARTVNWVKFTITKAAGSNIGLSELQVLGH